MKKDGFVMVLIIFLLFFISFGFIFYFSNLIPKENYTNEDFGIKKYISSIDKDEDGIDDQTDILNSVKRYVATKPIYKSKYYDTGYPNDKYGVCTDVVAFGLKGAGYDLMELVDLDIRNNYEFYNIDDIDKNIDFRRVRNLKIYFDRHAISLTTDLSKIKEWQGGDIVVFKEHIGVISDVRNEKGIPFVIHNTINYQKDYEEDILEKRDDIVAHYRIS